MSYSAEKTTICIVNYKTEELTRLCLRSIRKFTKAPYEVVVVDNNSGDSSLEYLRSLNWITLIERTGEDIPKGGWAHGTALNLALKECKTEYFMAMHSDTFIRREGWLQELVANMNSTTACTGGGKLDLKPAWQVFLKKITDVKALKRRIKNKKEDKFYIRTICALYNTEALHKNSLDFTLKMDEGVTCGKQLYYELLNLGYKTHPVSEWKMADMIYHLAHATMVLNPEFTVRDRTEKKFKKKIKATLATPEVQGIANDASLDAE